MIVRRIASAAVALALIAGLVLEASAGVPTIRDGLPSVDDCCCPEEAHELDGQSHLVPRCCCELSEPAAVASSLSPCEVETEVGALVNAAPALLATLPRVGRAEPLPVTLLRPGESPRYIAHCALLL